MTEKRITKVSTADLLEMKDESRSDAPEGPGLGPDFWKKARVVIPEGPKKQITVRLDADVVAWFKGQGKGYQTRINAVLRSFYEAHREPQE
jgi:uncharacterized protein (DUF4415 family)